MSRGRSVRPGRRGSALERLCRRLELEAAPGRPAEYLAARAPFVRLSFGAEASVGGALVLARPVPLDAAVAIEKDRRAPREPLVVEAEDDAPEGLFEREEVRHALRRMVGSTNGGGSVPAAAAGRSVVSRTALEAPAGGWLAGWVEPLEEPRPLPLEGRIASAVVSATEREGCQDALRVLRCAVAIGMRIVQASAGLEAKPTGRPGVVEVEDPYFGSRAAEIDPDFFASTLREHLPEEVEGERFLREWDGVADPDGVPRPGERYPVRAALGFVVAEHLRACRLAGALADLARGARGAGEVLALLLAEGEASGRELEALGLVSEADARLAVEAASAARCAGNDAPVAVRPRGAGAGVDVWALDPSTLERVVTAAVGAYERAVGSSGFVCLGDGLSLAAGGGAVRVAPPAR